MLWSHDQAKGGNSCCEANKLLWSPPSGVGEETSLLGDIPLHVLSTCLSQAKRKELRRDSCPGPTLYADVEGSLTHIRH